MRSRRRYRRRSRSAAPWPPPRLRKVDLEIDLAGQALEFLDAAPADQLAQRNDDGVGLRLEAEQFAGLFDDLLGKIQGRPHTIASIRYASGCQFTWPAAAEALADHLARFKKLRTIAVCEDDCYVGPGQRDQRCDPRRGCSMRKV